MTDRRKEIKDSMFAYIGRRECYSKEYGNLMSAIDALLADLERAKSMVRDMGKELARTNDLAAQVPVLLELAERYLTTAGILNGE